jgi:hypothetical protein
MLESRFIYTGNACGAGARIIRIDPDPAKPAEAPNTDYVVPIQGASCLPVTGGLSESQTSPFVYRVERPYPLTIMSVGSASTRAISGFPEARPFKTEVEVTVSGVSFIERVSIRRVAARMVSIHAEEDKTPRITPECVSIEGLSIDGYPITVNFDAAPFREHSTREQLATSYAKNAKFREQYFRQVGAKSSREKIPESKGLYVCSVVRSIDLGKNPPRGVTADRNRIRWEGVGTIILGELIVSDYYRRLTMVRVLFGSPIEGLAFSGDVQSNSVTMP